MRVLSNFYVFILISLILSCRSIDLYEKSVSIPGHAWKSSYQPSFSFTIKDTISRYQVYLVLRHNEKYSYNNIYVNLYLQPPGKDSLQKIKLPSLALANADGWLGSGMDDIYEHRIPLGEPQTLQSGTYTFKVEQIMREEPLEHVLNVGLRLEKKQ
ncbi:MAG TPA: gliding motility lipoprotein GldH [Chitinophagaceae bacterium]|nr:gliding motility lipoprotein GldH [Chitinophagaceae bacterium]